MAVRHLGELKKKNPMEAELKSRFTNPPTLWAYISLKPQRPGHRQTYAKSPRGSRGPGSRHLPQPAARAARCPRREGWPGRERTLAPAQCAPAWHLRPPLHPGTCKANLRLPGYLRETHEGKKGDPPARSGRCVLPPPASPRPALGTRGAGPPPPPVSAAPGEGASPGLGLPARPAAASSAPAASHTCPRGPPCPGPARRRPHGRPAALRSGDGYPRRGRSSP